MKNSKKLLIILVASILMVGGLLFISNPVFASSTDGTIDPTYKYAWSENAGWVNFGTTNGNVHITDSGLSGYALSETVGWIYLDDIINDGEGNLSGYAWGENVGYIKFNPTNGGVIINSSGEFTGSALGENIGWIIFDGDYNVKTDWRPQSARPACNNAIDDDGDGKIDYPADPGCSSLDDDNETDVGGGGGGNYNPPVPPENGFRILINPSTSSGQVLPTNSGYTNNSTVMLKLFGGSDTVNMAISNDINFTSAIQETYPSTSSGFVTKTWTLTSGDGIKTVFAKFYNQSGQSSNVVSAKIVFDTTPPEIKVSDLKDAYGQTEDIIFRVETEPKAELILRWDKKYGLTKVNDYGLAGINLGKMSVGSHLLEITATDLAGNQGETKIINLIIKLIEEIPLVEKEKTIIEKIEDLIPEFLKPKEEEKPAEIIIISEEAPLALQANYNLLVSYTIFNKPMIAFTQAPLPKEITTLAEKFPELSKTLNNVDVTKLADLEKLQTVSLTLPGLTERIGSSLAKIESGKLALLQGIPVAELSFASKQKIPTEIVFTKTGGGLIDYNISLSIDDQGQPQQKISTISGQPMQLVVKPDQPVKSVMGYLVFKSRNISLINANLESRIDANGITNNISEISESFVKISELADSIIFAQPVFAHPVRNADQIYVEGSKSRLASISRDSPQAAKINNGFESSNLLGSLSGINTNNANKTSENGIANDSETSLINTNEVSPVDSAGTSNGASMERELVLLAFEYTDPDHDGIYTANIQAPVAEGQYEIITVFNYKDIKLGSKEIRLITVVDPEGYVYTKIKSQELRIKDAIISLYWLNSTTKQYELWPAKEYQQENPQITDLTGKYSFLVPEGAYYLKVEAPGYLSYDGKTFEVKEGRGVHQNIELKDKSFWLRFDWQAVLLIFVTILLLIVALLLFYNFRRDKIREKNK